MVARYLIYRYTGETMSDTSQDNPQNTERENDQKDTEGAHDASRRDASNTTADVKSDKTNAAQSLASAVTVTHKERSEVEIVGEIPTTTLDRYREIALARLAKGADVPGFRKGHVPTQVVAGRIDPVNLLREIAEDVLSDAYPALVAEHALQVIGRPNVMLTHVVPGNPVGFKILTSVMPTISLPDYKAIAQEHRNIPLEEKELVVTDEEVIQVINNVRQREAHATWHEAHPDEEGHEHDDIPESKWPAFTDEMAQKLGDFKNVDDFKTKIRANIREEKEHKAKDAKRGALIEKLITGATIDVPEIFIQSELENMAGEFKAHLARMGLTWEGYLTHAQKSEEAVRDEWRNDAEKRAKLQLILNRIAEEERITPEESKVNREVAHLIEHYPDADEERARAYVESLETNKLVFALLEGENAEAEE